jgi:hypothetical protein
MVAGNERELAALVFFGFLSLVIYRMVLWIMEANRTADPWGPEIEQALDEDEAVPLCHHCLTPQEHNGWFCPHCGATVGPYCNYMPYIFLFSQGEVLRAGVCERLRHTPLIIIGYILVSLGFFSVLFPLFLVWVLAYWLFLAQNLRRPESEPGQMPPVIS